MRVLADSHRIGDAAGRNAAPGAAIKSSGTARLVFSLQV
jgi:hypothetical protein